MPILFVMLFDVFQAMRLPARDHLSGRVVSPLQTASHILLTEGVASEVRSLSDIVSEIKTFALVLQPRWELFSSYQRWVADGLRSEEPMFWDEDRWISRSAQYALAPCRLINENLSKLVKLTLNQYTQDQMKEVLKACSSDPTTFKQVSMLRQFAIHAEGSMEHEALDLIFTAANHFSLNLLQLTRDLATTSQPKDLLHSLIVLLPQHLQSQQPNTYPGLPFPYFHNYPELIKAELQLLNVPAILQNSAAPYYYPSPEDLLSYNPVLRAVLENNGPVTKSFISSFPELFGHRFLQDKTFTFVGAGFPLTGIMIHIETGASVNLVDYDQEAVKTARKFLKLTEKLGITRPGAFNVILADAVDVLYMPTQALPGVSSYHSNSTGKLVVPTGKLVVPTDILDLASALPTEVTAQVMRENALHVPIVRKRNVRGVSELLYERFILDETNSSFRLAGEVTPPQKAVNGATPEHLITGFTASYNINSCQLYVNTRGYPAKLLYLENMLSSPEYGCLKENVKEDVWDCRVKAYYQKRDGLKESSVEQTCNYISNYVCKVS